MTTSFSKQEAELLNKLLIAIIDELSDKMKVSLTEIEMVELLTYKKISKKIDFLLSS